MAIEEGSVDDETNTVQLAVTLTTAWLANPNTRCTPQDVHAFLKDSHATLVGLSQPGAAEEAPDAEAAEEFVPAVSVRRSLADPEHIVSMIDGKPYKTLRRHLSVRGLTPDAYRTRYGLKADYPMVAPGYAATRSRLAKELGLGRKGGKEPVLDASGPASDTDENADAATPGTAPTTKAPRSSRKRPSSKAGDQA